MEECICNLEEGEEKLIRRGSWNDLYLRLSNGEYRINAIADGIASMKIEYCPKCGKKLGEGLV